MSEKFNPKQYITNLRGKDYLEVKWRLVWFRTEHPKGNVSTEILNTAPLMVKAVISDSEGHILSTGHGSAQAKANAVWSGRELEKAETAAIGRALAHAGYGTQFTDEDEGDHLADSPNEKKPSKKEPTEAERKQNGRQKYSELFNRAKAAGIEIPALDAGASLEEIRSQYAAQLKIVEAKEKGNV